MFYDVMKINCGVFLILDLEKESRHSLKKKSNNLVFKDGRNREIKILISNEKKTENNFLKEKFEDSKTQ